MSSVSFCSYHPNGKIQWTGSCPRDSILDQAIGGLSVVVGDGQPDTHYVVAGLVIPRPQSNVAFSKTSVICNGVDEIVISNVPADTPIRITGPVYMSGVSDGGDVELDFDMPGMYKVHLELFPYLDMEVDIHAT